MIALDDVHIQAGDTELKVTLDVPTGSYGVLMGKTGSGKTTILETICGLRPQIGGSILLNNVDVSRCSVPGRCIGYVPQDLALFPQLNVYEHLAFSLRVRRWPISDIDQRVNELGEQLGIAKLLSRGPRNLSGGEKQRVALGRAIAFKPSVILLDEPLSALDDETRLEISELLLSLSNASTTILHVTHSTTEANALADRCFQLESGSIRRL